MAGGVPDFFPLLFTVTVPANTAIAAPFQFPLPVGNRRVDGVTVRIPPGPNGNVGWHLLWAGAQILPFSQGQSWLVGNNETQDFRLGIEVDGQLVFEGYNLDSYAHTLYVNLSTEEIPTLTGAAAVTIIDPAAIDNAAGG